MPTINHEFTLIHGSNINFVDGGSGNYQFTLTNTDPGNLITVKSVEDTYGSTSKLNVNVNWDGTPDPTATNNQEILSSSGGALNGHQIYGVYNYNASPHQVYQVEVETSPGSGVFETYYAFNLQGSTASDFLSGNTITMNIRSLGSTGWTNLDVICFARGTLIRTTGGNRRIEDLSVGDDVQTYDKTDQVIQWIGHRKFDGDTLKNNPKLYPVRIKKGALGEGLPKQDLIVSQQHRILVRSVIAQRMFGEHEVLIPAIKLIELDGIDVLHDLGCVEYFHILFDQHGIVYANGAPAESLLPGPMALNGMSLETLSEITAIFPEIYEADFKPLAARYVPEKGKRIKQFVKRHKHNRKPFFSV